VTGDRDLADDLVQETMARAIDRAGQYRGDAPLGAWLHRIALNAWRDHLRRRRLRRWVGLADPEAHRIADTGEPDAAVDVRAALGRLPERQRLAVVLRYYHDYDYASIAAALGVAPGTVGSLLARALERMARDLQAGPDRSA
jgi:RNA polymerase sigma-70 factor, ECF subfamily